MATLAMRLPVGMRAVDTSQRQNRLDELVQVLGGCGAGAAGVATDLACHLHDTDAAEPVEPAEALDVVAEALVRLDHARQDTGSPAASSAAGPSRRSQPD